MLKDFNNYEEGLVLIDFHAEWCGACEAMMPDVDEVSKDYNVLKVDVAIHKDFARKYKVMGLPTLMVLKDGEMVDRITTKLSKKQIIEMLEKHK